MDQNITLHPIHVCIMCQLRIKVNICRHLAKQLGYELGLHCRSRKYLGLISGSGSSFRLKHIPGGGGGNLNYVPVTHMGRLGPVLSGDHRHLGSDLMDGSTLPSPHLQISKYHLQKKMSKSQCIHFSHGR